MASGSQVWKGTMGTFTAKAAMKARASQNCTSGGMDNWYSAAISKVRTPWAW